MGGNFAPKYASYAIPEDSLPVTVSCMPFAASDRDMKRAGGDKVAPLGKLDFHALRTAYINFVLRDSTLSPSDMQDMARHGVARHDQDGLRPGAGRPHERFGGADFG